MTPDSNSDSRERMKHSRNSMWINTQKIFFHLLTFKECLKQIMLMDFNKENVRVGLHVCI